MTERRVAWLTACVAICACAAGEASGPPRGAPTRDDLARARRRVARLEAEAALTAARQPYVVVDLETRTLRYALMGLDLHAVPLAAITARGLVPAGAEAPDPRRLAAIVTLAEKEADPRLRPLTPEQIEAGADDENAADVMPPEAPAVYHLRFEQAALGLRVAGEQGRVTGLFAGVRSWWRAARAGARGRTVRLTLAMDGEAARAVYRSLVPGERLLLVPPPGWLLADVGQESPGSIRAARPAPAPTPKPDGEPGVPFRIPPPFDEPPLEADASAAVPAQKVDEASGEATREPPAEGAAPAPVPEAAESPAPQPGPEPAPESAPPPGA